MNTQSTHTEEYEVSGDSLLSKVREVIHAGNVRHIMIKDHEGQTLVNIPLTVGVVGTILGPQIAAVGAIAALVTRCSITVEKVEMEEDETEKVAEAV